MSLAVTTTPRPKCEHCALELTAAQAASGERFCCNGCATVFELLNSRGFGEYYDLREISNRGAIPAQTTARRFCEFDTAEFAEEHLVTTLRGNSQLELYVEGIHCAGCVWLLEQLPRITDGVVATRVNFQRGLATVEFAPAEIAPSAVAKSIAELGYTPHPHRHSELDAHRRREERRALARIAVAGAMTGNIMFLAFAQYSGDFNGIAPEFRRLFGWVSLLFAIPVVFYSGWPFLRSAVRALRTGILHIDLPIAIGILVGFVAGAAATVAGRHEVYFDSLSALIFFLSIGRFLQRRQQTRAIEATELHRAVLPSIATLLTDRGPEEVPTSALRSGDIVRINPGDLIPVDGIIVRGSSSVDAALLTGESVPRTAAAGDAVSAGCTNLSRVLEVEVRAISTHTRIGKLLDRIEREGSKKAPLLSSADRLAGRFVAATLALAVLAYVLGSREGWAEGLDRAVALLVISCPCALGLATPLAVTVALARAARRGILIKGSAALEYLAQPGTYCFDKTGTLTVGVLRVTEWHGDSALLDLVAGIEAHSSHPAARALHGASPNPVEVSNDDVCLTLGGGIAARVGDSDIRIGSPAFVRGTLGEGHAQVLDTYRQRGDSPVLVEVDGRVRALAALGDEPNRGAADLLRKLRADGNRLRLASGDDPAIVALMAQRLGFDPGEAWGGMSPEDKAALLDGLPLPRFMVGDGVNDALALARAEVGIAVRGGAEASLAAADVYLGTAGVGGVTELVSGAKHTLATIQKNHRFSLAYNVVGATLALFGLVGPLTAAVLMPLSSILVIVLSLRNPAFGGR